MLSMDDVAPRRSVRGIKLSVGETRIGALEGCRGLTQVEFDRASIARTQAKRVGVGGGNENGRSRASAVSPERKRSGSGAAPPQTAIAPRHELQVVLVAR